MIKAFFRVQYLLLALPLLSFQYASGQKHPSRLDSLVSDQQVAELIHRINPRYQPFRVAPIGSYRNSFDTSSCQRISDSLGITKSFYKSDFDRNGYTDLLVFGIWSEFVALYIMNYGGDSLMVGTLTRRVSQDCVFPKLINDTILRYYYMDFARRGKVWSSRLVYKDLLYKFGDFIEYTPSPRNYAIEKIEFETSHCFGICPVFMLSVLADKTATLNAFSYNRERGSSKELKGDFHTILKQNSFNEIIELLNYINFPILKNEYSVNWTDDQTVTVKITYNNGQIKKIRDYGLQGSFGLTRLYELFFDLRFNQEWNDE